MSEENHQPGQDNVGEDLANEAMGKAGELGKKAGKAVGRKVGKAVGKLAKKALKEGGKLALKLLAKVLVAIAPYIGVVLIVLLVIFAGYYVLFETRGTEQKYSLENTNNLELTEDGYFSAKDLGSENKAILQFYQYFSKNSYYQILDSGKKAELPKPEIKDYYNKEELFKLSSNMLFSLDEYMYQNKFRYPEQFVKPINFDADTLKLKDLVDKNGAVVVESFKYDKDGKKTTEKQKTVSDFGLGSIFKYETKKRTLTIEGNYVGQDVWDNSSKSVVRKATAPQPFKDTMVGYPQDMFIMTKAITFSGEYEYEYTDQSIDFAPLSESIGEKNTDSNKIWYADYEETKEVCSTSTVGKISTTTCHTVHVATHHLYKYREGSVFETMPRPTSEKTNIVGVKYLRDYLYNFRTFMPESVMNSFELTESDFNSRVGEFISSNLSVGSGVNSAKYRKAYQYISIVQKYATQFGVDPNLIIAKMTQESGGDPNINDDGLMQITGSGQRSVSAKDVSGVMQQFSVQNTADRKDPEKSIHWAVMYFADKKETYEGDDLKALQSYNFDIGIIKQRHPEAWDSLEWMNYREEVRLHYGGSTSRSVSYDCAPQLEKTTGSVYGDVCYIEHVMQFYAGGNYGGLEGHDQQSSGQQFTDGVKNFFIKVLNLKEADAEPHKLYEHHAGAMEVDWILNMTTALQSKTLFSANKNPDTVSMWEREFSALSSSSLTYEDFSKLTPGLDGYTPPVNIPNPIISAKFGMRVHPISGEYKPHNGVDVAIPSGTPLYAITDGKVEIAVNDQGSSTTSWGNYVKIKHTDGTSALYGHMSTVMVTVGQTVKSGQVIGKSGNSGSSTGAHLHFEFYDATGKVVDPYYILVKPKSFLTTGATGKVAEVINLAFKELGKPYVWGATGPNSFDCSGLIQYVFGKVGVVTPRVTTDQIRAGQAVSESAMQPGDIILFDTTGGGKASHVGIYLGNNRFIHAPKTGDVVKITEYSTYYRDRFVGARRYI